MYAVLGNPIRHSLSPQIFKLFAAQYNQTLVYHTLQVKAEDLAGSLSALRSEGYQGVNLTTPLKEKAFLLAEELSPEARCAGAINMLSFQEEGRYYGHNSDGAGFLRDLVVNKKYSIQGKSVLILGAGGAVRGLLGSLLQEQPQQIVIFNRTEQKAKRLLEDFQEKESPLYFSSWQELPRYRFDLLIHCTTLGLQGEKLPFPAQILNPGACCYDLSYGKSALPFLLWSQEQGASFCYDGLGMLIEQAAEAFYIWQGKSVNTQAVLRQLENTF